MKTSPAEGLRLRLLTAFTLIPIAVVLVWWPVLHIAYQFMVILLVLLGAREFFKLAQGAGIEVIPWAGVPLAAIIPLAAGFGDSSSITPHFALISASFSLILFHMFTMKHSIAGMAASVFGLLYAGYCGSFFVTLHQTPAIGPGLITILVFTIGCSDTGAYLIGKAVGRHKLAPKISPNKTIEGSVAALMCGALAGAALYWLKSYAGWSAYPSWPLAQYMVAGLLLSVIGQLGDLVESTLKRNAGVKDSGAIFPGHGGALDRCDAFLFGAPALYYFVLFVGNGSL